MAGQLERDTERLRAFLAYVERQDGGADPAYLGSCMQEAELDALRRVLAEIETTERAGTVARDEVMRTNDDGTQVWVEYWADGRLFKTGDEFTPRGATSRYRFVRVESLNSKTTLVAVAAGGGEQLLTIDALHDCTRHRRKDPAR